MVVVDVVLYMVVDVMDVMDMLDVDVVVGVGCGWMWWM